jgi:hypothetical protein
MSVFPDVTTLYFETDDQGDDLRRSGFSKDGKHAHPQIVYVGKEEQKQLLKLLNINFG